ncbi:hypothetical protein D1872_245490 [compost metagenome]
MLLLSGSFVKSSNSPLFAKVAKVSVAPIPITSGTSFLATNVLRTVSASGGLTWLTLIFGLASLNFATNLSNVSLASGLFWKN